MLYLKMIAEAEQLSLNDAINLIISRYRYYPKDMAEIHEQVTHALSQLEVIEGQLELCALHEFSGFSLSALSAVK